MTTPKAKRARSYCWTLNNPNANEEHIRSVMPPFNYLVFQLEQGESGTPHYQGYVNFKNQVSFSTLKDRIPGAHWEVAKGTGQQNRTYCTKEPRLDGPWEFGRVPNQGKRTDLSTAVDLLRSEGRKRTLALMPEIFAKYPKGMDLLALEFSRPETFHVERKVHLLYGPSRTGKSFKARQCDPDHFVLCDTKWWDGFDGQDTIIMDDYGAGWKMRIPDLLRYTDNYQDITVQVKGGHRWFTPTNIILTSNFMPRDWHNWEGKEIALDALARRFDSVLIMSERDGDHIELTKQEHILYFFKSCKHGFNRKDLINLTG